MWLLIAQAIYLLMPAYFANMAPVIAMRAGLLKGLAEPLDGGRKFSDGRALFGSHKTYRGLVCAVLAGMLIALIQSFLLRFAFFAPLSVLPYDFPFLIGFLLGLGAILGDLVKSFFKRRVNLASGRPWVPFDQIDFVLGAYVLLSLFYSAFLTASLFWTSLAVSFLLHVLTNHTAFWLGVRREKW
ncbi:MAG: CDP-2,3-bis-(O-geranylgeranyl)-sn-glycerol synthase [Nanoarchaeota archaeon]|nr:CDP-2,3-bis-(O-geranylgeranyl)-sn-glycerol synthase [Nanoarchaeota archaeon]